MKKHTILSIFSLMLLLAACSGSKKFYKKGHTLEKAGLTTEAADFYIEALKRNRTNEKAIIALKKTGQAALDEKLTVFYKAYADERYKEAVYAYRQADSFKNQVEGVGVKLSAPDYYQDYYKEARDIYVAELYDKAQNYLDQEDFAQAETMLKEIRLLDPAYRNVNELSDFAFVEPKYRQALHAYDVKRYRQAYYLFKEINDRTQGYKESQAYMELALESAQFAIGLLPIENKTGVPNLESAIAGAISRDLKALNDPFLKIIDRSNTDAILQEQFYNMTGAVDRNTAIETGTLLGSKAILVGKVVGARTEEGKLMKYSRTGWLGKEVRYIDADGVKRTKLVFDKVFYTEFEQQNKVSCTFQYQLISTETGEILLTDVVEFSQNDQVNYATFTGDARHLYAGYWESQSRNLPSDRRFSSYSEKRELDGKLNARRTVKSIEELTNNMLDRMGNSVAQKVKAYNPEKS